jgi:hypothetical protein
MIELRHDRLHFSFPDVHEFARVTIEFQRTLRIPDDTRTYPLPPGLGAFPLRHVDDGTEHVPTAWLTHGGVMLPMYQAEAMWIQFSAEHDEDRDVAYPFAIRIAAGKINAVTGQQWTRGLHEDPQDYVVVPEQPWLDGFCVTKGTIRQFVAMPLGQGYTAEEQITGTADHGGVQVVVYPMKREVFERRFPKQPRVMGDRLFNCYNIALESSMPPPAAARAASMGLAPGGRMKQDIYDDPFSFDDWDQAHGARCYVHLANSEMWRLFTGEAPPHRPPTAADYTQAGLPWFDFYGEHTALEGSPILSGLKSVTHIGGQKGEMPLPKNEPFSGEEVISLGRKRSSAQVREGTF